MKTPENFYEVNLPENKGNKRIFFLDNLFYQLKKSEWISKDFFASQLNNFQKKNPEWYKIFQDIFSLVDQNGVDNTKGILALTLLIEKIQKIKWDQTEKVFEALLKTQPALFWKLLKWFYDDVEKIIMIEKNKEAAEKNKEIAEKNKEIWFNFINEKEITNNQIKQTAEKLLSLVDQKAPQYKEKITDLTQQIQQKYNVNPDMAYLAAFRYFYNNNPDFKNRIWKLDSQTKAVLFLVNIHISKLDAEKVVSISEVKSQVENFTQNNDYKDKIKDSVDTTIDVQNLDLAKFKLLTEQYPNQVKDFLEKNNLTYEDLQSYLNWENNNPKINQLKTRLISSFSTDFTNTYTREYPSLAMTIYLKEIFTMFNETLGFENIQKDFSSAENLKIDEKGNIDLSFKYKNVPLQFQVKPDGTIQMSDYLKENKWVFQKWWSVLNEIFQFIGLKNLLNPDKIKVEKFLDKDWRNKLKDTIQSKIQEKINQNNKLWNKEIMKTETQFEVKRQYAIYNTLELYRPPYDLSFYDKWLAEISKEKRPGLYHILNAISNTINFKAGADTKISQAYSNENFREFMKDLDFSSKISTYELFTKLNMFNSLDQTINSDKLLKLSQAIQTKNLLVLNTNLPVEGYKWEIKNEKVVLKKEQSPDDFLYSSIPWLAEEELLKKYANPKDLISRTLN